MPYQLRNRTRVEKTESASSSAASSATLEHNEDGATPLSRGSGTNRLKRGLSGSTKEGAGEFYVLRTGIMDHIHSNIAGGAVTYSVVHDCEMWLDRAFLQMSVTKSRREAGDERSFTQQEVRLVALSEWHCEGALTSSASLPGGTVSPTSITVSTEDPGPSPSASFGCETRGDH
ncbi:hypothetical protein DL98DRAFT_541708 [Cadophora sp. DSE1049]|nr:hypothetical protein DL98DRAFT_541708 [Cadophora sp. DSE1049]